MDPLSITVAVGGVCKLAYNLAETVYSGVEKTKHVDVTLKAFAKEISVLGDTLKLVENGLNEPTLRSLAVQTANANANANANLANVLESLKKVLADCKDTLAKLDVIITEATSGFRKTVFRRSMTALKLNFKSDEITIIRQEIRSYTNAMHMTLSMLNISLVLSQNQPSVDTQLSLRNRITSLEESSGALRSDIELSEQLSSSDGVRKKTHNLNQCLRNSESVLSGASLYIGSTDRTSLSDADMLEDAAGSVLGLDTEQRLAIESWRRDESEGQSKTTTGNLRSELIAADARGGNNFSAKLESRRLERAVLKFDQKDYAEAEKLLKAVISNSYVPETGPSHQVHDAQVLLALTYQSQKKLQDAIDLLHGLLSAHDLSISQRSLIKHRLAESYLADSRATHALPWSIAACEERHDLQEKKPYFESCLLAANIYQSLGDSTEAELYLEDLPPIYRSVLMFPASTITLAVSTLKSLKGHDSWVNSVSISPDGNKIASGANDNLVNFWSIPIGGIATVLDGYAQPVTSVAFSPTGRTLVAGSEDKTVRFWDSSNGRLLGLADHEEKVTTVAFSPDGRSVASAGGFADRSRHYDIRLWDSATQVLLKIFTGHSAGIAAVTFSPDNRIIASGSHDKTARLWDVASGSLLKTLRGHSDWITSIAVSSNAQIIASGSRNGTLIFWDAATGALRARVGHMNEVYSVAFLPMFDVTVSVCGERDLTLSNAATGRFLKLETDTTSRLVSIAVSPDGDTIVCGDMDGHIEILRLDCV